MPAAGQPLPTADQTPLQIASTVHPVALQSASPQGVVTAPSSNGEDAQKKMNKKKDPSQSSDTLNDNSADPSPTPTPVNGLPVNQYMPHLQTNGHHSPSPLSQQPNISGQQYLQPAPTSSQPQRPPQNSLNASSLPNFQAAVPTQLFNSVAPQRNVQPKPNIPTSQGTPQQAAAQHASSQNQMHPVYPHMQMPQAATGQRLAATQNQNGRATPQGQPARTPMNPNAANAQRGSPLVTNQTLNSRSPMPNSQPGPQMTHPTNQHPNFSAMAQNQYNMAHLRAIQNGQHLQPHMMNGGPSQGQQMQPSQDQQGHTMMPQYPHMYSYAQMGMNYGIQSGRLPPAYTWPVGMGRGMPINGQHQMPGMASNAAHPQQMLNVGKVVPGGMQGR